MVITSRELVEQYGSTVSAGNGALFVGAGLSLDAGYPGWASLLRSPRRKAGIPAGVKDLPLVAQYFIQQVPGGREDLESHILRTFSDVTTDVSDGHRAIAELPIDDIWTTNYDRLIEAAIPNVTAITKDSDLERRHLGRRRVMKMHGSIGNEVPLEWDEAPTITRQDYETYEGTHPRLWAALRATYLTKSILFLGFSFTDPNVEVLLRLSRSLFKVGAPEHFTVLKRPTEANELKLHRMQADDLERSGVAVCEIGEYSELTPILKRLVRRTRSQRLFISGSDRGASEYARYSRQLGSKIADMDIDIASLAGKPAMVVSYTVGSRRIAESTYHADRIRFYFRHRPGEAKAMEQRLGTITYSSYDTNKLRETVIDSARAVVVIGGGSNTKEEVDCATSLGVPVIPLAVSGGAARLAWDTLTFDQLGLEDTGENRLAWRLLEHEDEEDDIATSAAVRLLRAAMFLDSNC